MIRTSCGCVWFGVLNKNKNGNNEMKGKEKKGRKNGRQKRHVKAVLGDLEDFRVSNFIFHFRVFSSAQSPQDESVESHQ